MINTTEIWPPPYTIKKHKLAKQVKLKTSEKRGLEIIVPLRFNLKHIPTILEENKTWIVKHLSLLSQSKIQSLPDKIIFQAIPLTLNVKFEPCDAKLEMLVTPNQEIVLVGNIKNHEACKNKLITWIKNLSKEYLSFQLEMLSNKTQLKYKNLTIRDQQTLWGSCTINQSISLNYKLIFLPHRLLQHIIIHELCHTKHLNHSSKFWNQVSVFDPDWRIHKKELRYANHHLPAWL